MSRTLAILRVAAPARGGHPGGEAYQPYTRQLRGKLRELRFHLGRERRRVSYYIASGRRIVLLAVFRKTKMREVQEVARAEAAMLRCIAEGHTAED